MVTAAPAVRVLVTGAGTGLGNNVIRSLRAGDPDLEILGCHHDRFALTKADTAARYLVPPAEHVDFARTLRRLVHVARVSLVVPTHDHEVRAVSRLRRRLGCAVFLPHHRAIELCQDKYVVTTHLRARGVPAPLTYPVRDVRGLGRLFRRLPGRDRVWCRVRRGSGSLGATAVRTSAQARAWIELWRDMRGIPPHAFTLCEYLPGRDFGCQSVWHDGRLVLAKTFERLAYFGGDNQPSGVSSVASLARSVEEPSVVEVCAAAVRAIDARASGLFCIDLKADARGVPCVTDINVGRFSLTTGLYDLIGKHNTADVYLRLALGRPVDVGDPYDVAPGHYLARDVDTLPAIVDAEELFQGVTDLR